MGSNELSDIDVLKRYLYILKFLGKDENDPEIISHSYTIDQKRAFIEKQSAIDSKRKPQELKRILTTLEKEKLYKKLGEFIGTSNSWLNFGWAEAFGEDGFKALFEALNKSQT